MLSGNSLKQCSGGESFGTLFRRKTEAPDCRRCLEMPIVMRRIRECNFKFWARTSAAAFIQITGVHADTLQRARQASASAFTQGSGAWRARRSVAYLDCRAWLLDYAQSHADSSPLNDSLWLPNARKFFYWCAYKQDRLSQGKPNNEIAEQTYFLKMWRTELPWIKIRTANGPFTHCGLCDYLKWLITSASDKSRRNDLNLCLGCLGRHFQFQAAQRVAVSNIFRRSEADPDELLATDHAAEQHSVHEGWIPLVVSLITPGLLSQPLIYSIMEDQTHGQSS